ncbi:MAG: hypothetical protein LBP89_06880 [Helicobacteraceae bacterium]|jgi:uncharacterized membrane protein|nr:hypothetical protein [Helicobacteraceae bacterium]
MRLSAPSKIVFIVSIVVAVLALASHLIGLIGGSLTIPFFTANSYWTLAAAYILLALGVTIKGL